MLLTAFSLKRLFIMTGSASKPNGYSTIPHNAKSLICRMFLSVDPQFVRSLTSNNSKHKNQGLQNKMKMVKVTPPREICK